MYNGMGLQTPRGSGTNGYVQANRFFVRSKTTTSTAVASGSGLSPAMVGCVRKADKGVVEHERKRRIQLKLLQLEESLEDLGYTEDEIAKRLAEAEDESSSSERDFDKRLTDDNPSRLVTDARKEKHLQATKTALGIKEMKREDVL